MDQGKRTAFIRQAHALVQEHEESAKRAAIMLDAESRWLKALNKHDRRNREYVLLALKSEKVPPQLSWTWGGFDRTCPAELKNDREIFLQRLELDSFQAFHGHRAYRVPQVFRNDKEVMLKVVSKNSLALSLASNELQNDRQVVMAAIQNPHPVALQAFQYASKKLRGDRRIVRAVLRHGHGVKALKLLPRKLQEDYDLVLLAVKSSSEECNKTYEILEHLSDEMVDEADIVYEAVKRRGSNLRFVQDLVLLEDPVIIKAACRNDGTAIQYCPESPVRESMLQGSNLLMLIKSGGVSEGLEAANEAYWENPKYLVPAVENDMLLSSEWMDDLYKENRPLLMEVLCHSKFALEQYRLLPKEGDIRRDPSVGMTILLKNNSIEFEEGSLALHLSHEITDNEAARKHIDKLLLFAHNGSAYSGGDVWGEKTIVVALCKFNGDYYKHASDPLKTDRDVVRATFSDCASYATIRSVPLTLLHQNHDIAALAIKACSTSDWSTPSDLYKHFGGDLMTRKVVLMEWVRKGWETSWLFPRNFRFNDQEVALEAIKHAQVSKYDVWVFQRLFKRLPSQKLLRDKAFMLSAVEVKPEILKLSRGGLLQDFDYMFRVAGMGRKALLYLSHKGKELDTLIDCAAQVRATLAVVDCFVVQFLGAMSIDPPRDKRAKRRRTCRGPEPRCHLRMLDVGSDFTIKKSIAEFAGVPLGADLKLLHTALDTLHFWGY